METTSKTYSRKSTTSTKPKSAVKKKGFIREWGPLILIVLVILISRIFVWGTVQVDGPSMDPTLGDKQMLIETKVGGFGRGDVVVAKETVAQTQKNNDPKATTGKTIVKRVVGLPGDTLVFDKDKLTINGKVYSQPWLKQYKDMFDTQKLADVYKSSLAISGVTGKELQQQRDQFAMEAGSLTSFTVDSTGNPSFTVKVPAGEYFLMGDNRIVSADSRLVGGFTKSQIVGKVLFRFWPITKIGLVK